jgi:hypothetical protein
MTKQVKMVYDSIAERLELHLADGDGTPTMLSCPIRSTDDNEEPCHDNCAWFSEGLRQSDSSDEYTYVFCKNDILGILVDVEHEDEV